jgi:hypothetical protein
MLAEIHQAWKHYVERRREGEKEEDHESLGGRRASQEKQKLSSAELNR